PELAKSASFDPPEPDLLAEPISSPRPEFVNYTLGSKIAPGYRGTPAPRTCTGLQVISACTLPTLKLSCCSWFSRPPSGARSTRASVAQPDSRVWEGPQRGWAAGLPGRLGCLPGSAPPRSCFSFWLWLAHKPLTPTFRRTATASRSNSSLTIATVCERPIT